MFANIQHFFAHLRNEKEKLGNKTNKSKFNVIRLKRLWRKHFENKKDPARLDIDLIIDSHVKELCGSNWSTFVNILPESTYTKDLKSFQDEAEQNSSEPNREPDK